MQKWLPTELRQVKWASENMWYEKIKCPYPRHGRLFVLTPLPPPSPLPPYLPKDSISGSYIVLIILNFETPAPLQFPLTPCRGLDSFWKCTSGQSGVHFKGHKRWWSWGEPTHQAYSGGQLTCSFNLSVILISYFYFRGPQRKQELTHLLFPLWGRKWR